MVVRLIVLSILCGAVYLFLRAVYVVLRVQSRKRLQGLVTPTTNPRVGRARSDGTHSGWGQLTGRRVCPQVWGEVGPQEYPQVLGENGGVFHNAPGEFVWFLGRPPGNGHTWPTNSQSAANEEKVMEDSAG